MFHKKVVEFSHSYILNFVFCKRSPPLSLKKFLKLSTSCKDDTVINRQAPKLIM